MEEIIILPIMGALIGYTTNWLAIKMIFRPYEEKKIFGIKIPFTPGVMAKERYVLSKKLGDTLATNVITDDEVLKHISNIDFYKIIKDGIENTNADTKLSAFVQSEDSLELGLVSIKKNLKIILKSVITDKEIEDISENIVEAIKNNFLSEGKFKNIFTKDEKATFIKTLKNNESLLNILKSVINKVYDDEELKDKQLVDVLGQDILDEIFNKIDENSDVFRMNIKDYVESESFDYIQNIIENVIKNGVGKIPMLAMFGGDSIVKMVAPSIHSSILEYFSDEDNNENIADFLKHITSDLGQARIKKYTDVINDEIVYDLGVLLVNSFLESLEKNIDDIDDGLVNSIIQKNIYIVEDKLKIIIRCVLLSILKDDLKIDLIVDKIVSNALEVKVGTLTEHIGDTEFIKMGEVTKDILIKNVGTVLKEIDFSKIVEEKINTFDMKEAETLVIDVVNKELKMITYLGGVLGAIFGVIGTLT